MNTFHRLLRDQLVNGDGDIDVYNTNFKNWPNEDGEPLDLENYRFFELTDEKLVMCAGGDWQEGAVLTITLADGELAVTGVSNDFPETVDMSDEEVLEILNRE